MDNLTYNAKRRDFIKAGIILGGGLLISFSVPLSGCKSSGKKALNESTTFDDNDIFTPNAYLSIRPDNQIKVLLNHQEMGQGVWTSLTMLIADELDANFKDILVEHAPPGEPYLNSLLKVSVTGASTSTYTEFERYRTAGATARALLVTAAAQKAGVEISQCSTADGYVMAGNKKFSFGDLAKEAAQLPAPQNVKLKEPKDWKYIGKGVKRLDTKVKTNGEAKFGMDMLGEHLLIAVVAHCPYIGGKLISFDDTATIAIPGVKKVVRISTGVAVLATNYWSATKGKKALKIVWDKGSNTDLSSKKLAEEYRRLAATDGAPAVTKGNYKTALKNAVKVVKGEFVFPYLAHAPMEPLNCTVKLTTDGCEIWVGTQMPGFEQEAAAKVLGIPKEKVKLNTLFLGGGFGRRCNPNSDWVIEATEIAKASGEFIKMIWAREDDITGQFYRPMYVHKFSIGLDRSGMPVAWQQNIVGQSIYATNAFPSLVKDGVDVGVVEGAADSHYKDAIPNMFIGCHLTKTPVSVLWWRSVGNSHTAYAIETMIDQIAHAAGSDPVAYRRKLLENAPRSLAVLNVAAEKSGWNSPLPAGRYRGVAVHASFRSYIAHIVEISLADGHLVVHKVTCAVDCGFAVNPDGVRMQMESAIIFGLTMALYGELSIEHGQVVQRNFYDYKIARMNETPQIDVHLVPNSGQMGGIGEPGVPPLAPALANAIFSATGELIYNLPFMNHKLKPA